MAIPVLPQVWCCPWLCLGRGYYQHSRITEARPHVRDYVHLSSRLRATKPWRMWQRWPRYWVPHCPEHISSLFLHSDSCRQLWELVTHTLPFCLSSPNLLSLSICNQPVILKPSKCTIHKAPASSLSTEVALKEGRCLWVPASQDVQDAAHTRIQTLMKCLCPPLPSPFKWIQLHLETISPACLNPSRVCSIGLARACLHLMPSLVSLMSKQLPSKSWASFLNFLHCFEVSREKILQLQNDLHQCALANDRHCSSPESLLDGVLRIF